MPIPELVYHYTYEDGLRGILSTNTMWATHFADLNDTEEVRDIVKFINRFGKRPPLPKGRKEFCEITAEILCEFFLENKVDFYITSFSKDSNSQFMWKKELTQYALSLDVTTYNQLLGSENNYALGTEPLHEVLYNKIHKTKALKAWQKELHAAYFHGDQKAEASLKRRCTVLPALFKNSVGWKDQKEVRAIFRYPVNLSREVAGEVMDKPKKTILKRKDKEGKTVRYIETLKNSYENIGISLHDAITGIIVGPAGSIEVAKNILASNGLANIPIITSA